MTRLQSRLLMSLYVVLFILVSFYVFVNVAFPLSGLRDSGCHDQRGYEGIYFFDRPLILTDVGRENQRVEAYDRDRITVCPANLRTVNPTRFEIGWLSVYLLGVLLLIGRAVYRRRKKIATI